MRKEYSIYRAVKLVSDETDKHDATHPTRFDRTGYTVWHPTTRSIKQALIKKYKISSQEANAVVASAIREGFLVGSTRQVDNEMIDVLCVDVTKGTDLLNDIPYMPFVKLGLIEYIWSKHGRFIGGVLTGAILPLFVLLVRSLMGYLFD